MRQGFTLIELMIVIAIIAVIAAIAIPNLLESRISSQEAGAASALKSGVYTAEVSFQSGCYNDFDNNGIGTYAVVGINGSLASNVATAVPFEILSGKILTTGSITLNLLPFTYAQSATVTTNNTTATNVPQISGYIFSQPISSTAPASATATVLDGSAERDFGVSAAPVDINNGRRGFAINQGGNVYSSKPSSTIASHVFAGTGGDMSVLKVFGASLITAPNSTLYLPYRR